MSVSDAVASEFSRSTRLKGDAYARRGRVEIEEGSADTVSAIIQGTRPYHVTIARRAGDDHVTTFEVSCECPFYGEGLAPCKHIWALFRIADDERYLLPE